MSVEEFNAVFQPDGLLEFSTAYNKTVLCARLETLVTSVLGGGMKCVVATRVLLCTALEIFFRYAFFLKSG